MEKEENLILELINQRVSQLKWVDSYVYKFESNSLTIVGSQDFCYYHNFEISFKDVHFYSGVFSWKWDYDDAKVFIEIIDDLTSKVQINQKFRVEQGNTLFKLNNTDGLEIFIGCRSVAFSNELVKY